MNGIVLWVELILINNLVKEFLNNLYPLFLIFQMFILVTWCSSYSSCYIISKILLSTINLKYILLYDNVINSLGDIRSGPGKTLRDIRK